jgi:hypothetical protein
MSALINPQKPRSKETDPTPVDPALLIPAFVGASLPTSPPDPTPNELVAPGGMLQLTLPQTYPLGQHPPPTDGAQVVHPVAQLPVSRLPGAVIPLPVGATMVSPDSDTSVVTGIAGHDVLSQLRPT